METFYILDPLDDQDESGRLAGLLAALDESFRQDHIFKIEQAYKITTDHPALFPILRQLAGVAEKPAAKPKERKSKPQPVNAAPATVETAEPAPKPEPEPASSLAESTSSSIIPAPEFDRHQTATPPTPTGDQQPARRRGRKPSAPKAGKSWILPDGKAVGKATLKGMLRRGELTGGTRIKGPLNRCFVVINEPGQKPKLHLVTNNILADDSA